MSRELFIGGFYSQLKLPWKPSNEVDTDFSDEFEIKATLKVAQFVGRELSDLTCLSAANRDTEQTLVSKKHDKPRIF